MNTNKLGEMDNRTFYGRCRLLRWRQFIEIFGAALKLRPMANEPGAADFYYGEMEMRRYSKEASLAERAIIWIYWIVSGYGLRASRAFAWLLALIVGGAATMAIGGFAEGSATYLNGLIFSIRAALPGMGSSNKLTMIGEFVEIGLSLLGPVFFALALLALRGRVKR
jgi:hypothetical protein